MITLDEITPEKVRELTDETTARRNTLVNRLAVERLCERVSAADRELEHAKACRLMRARSMAAEGMPVTVIAEWFRVGVSEVRGWLRADVQIQLSSKGGNNVE
jgi:hypothetical protein